MKKLLAVLLCLLMLAGCGSSNNDSASDSSTENAQETECVIDDEVEDLENYILANQFDEVEDLIEKLKKDKAIELGTSTYSSIDYANKVVHLTYEGTDSDYICAFDKNGEEKYIIQTQNEDTDCYISLYEYSFPSETETHMKAFFIAKSGDEVSHESGEETYVNGVITSSSFAYEDGTVSSTTYQDGVMISSEWIDSDGTKYVTTYDENGNPLSTDYDLDEDSYDTAWKGIVGTWESDHEEGASIYFIITFNEDGTGTINVCPNGSSGPMTYELDGETVIIHQDGMDDDTSLTYNEVVDDLSGYTRID